MTHAYRMASRVYRIISRVYLCDMCLLITHIDCFAASPRFAPLFDLKATKRCTHILLSL